MSGEKIAGVGGGTGVCEGSDMVQRLVERLDELDDVCEIDIIKSATIPPARSCDRQEDLRIEVMSVLFEEGCENENTRTRG